jgi:hypothetical protein
VNPFAALGLESSDRETPTATFDELQAFRAEAIEMRLPSLATAVLIGTEWVQREVDIFATFEVGHYRPKEQPNAVRIVQQENRRGKLDPALCRQGAAFSPMLTAELEAIKKVRIGGLTLALAYLRLARAMSRKAGRCCSIIIIKKPRNRAGKGGKVSDDRAARLAAIPAGESPANRGDPM